MGVWSNSAGLRNTTETRAPASAASGKLRSPGRTNFSPTSNISLQPTRANGSLLEHVKFRRAPLRGLQPLRYDASSVRRQRRGRGLLIRSWELPADSLPCPTPPTHAAHSGLQNDTPPTTGVCVLWESTSGKQYSCLQTITQLQ